MKLSEAIEGQFYFIQKLEHSDENVISRFCKMGIYPGAQILLKRRAPIFKDPLLFEIDGLSHREIATIMKCTEGTVRSRLHYAKIQLQSLLSDYLK